MKDDPIDIEAKVTPIEHSLSDSRAYSLAVKHSVRQGIFDPPINPEMRGRRPSGNVFKAKDVPKECRGVPLVEEPAELNCSKRSAKSVAEELTGRPVQVRENKTGRCEIEIVFPMERLVFEGNTWFLALSNLHTWLKNRNNSR